MVPLGSTVPHLRPRFAYILGNYEHARSQLGRQPAAAKPPLYNYNIIRAPVASGPASVVPGQHGEFTRALVRAGLAKFPPWTIAYQVRY